MASPVDTSVKFFTDEMAGAPVVSGTPSALITALDACLVNGFGSKSLTSLAVSGGIATATFAGGASAAQPQSVILVAGVTGGMTDLNGEQKVLTVSSTTVTFATALADGTASGTISFKMAPLGWTKVYSGTNKAVYKPSAVEASSALLRVDDSGTTSARVRMYETMTDIDTGTNPAPTDDKVSGGLYWWKSDTASGAARRYTIYGDGRNVYVGLAPYIPNTHTIFAFGDLDSYKSGDAYCGFICGAVSAVTTVPLGNLLTQDPENNETMQIMRSHTGIGAAVASSRRAVCGSTGGGSGVDNRMGVFPAPSNNGLFLSRMVVGQQPFSTYGPRGVIPGILYVPQTNTAGGVFSRGATVDGTGEYAGKKIYAVPQTNGQLHTAQDYASFFDVTGPWRE